MRLIADRRIVYVFAVLAVIAALVVAILYKSGKTEAQASNPLPSKTLPQETLHTVQITSPKAQSERDVFIRGEKVPEHLRTNSRTRKLKNQP